MLTSYMPLLTEDFYEFLNRWDGFGGYGLEKMTELEQEINTYESDPELKERWIRNLPDYMKAFFLDMLLTGYLRDEVHQEDFHCTHLTELRFESLVAKLTLDLEFTHMIMSWMRVVSAEFAEEEILGFVKPVLVQEQ